MRLGGTDLFGEPQLLQRGGFIAARDFHSGEPVASQQPFIAGCFRDDGGERGGRLVVAAGESVCPARPHDVIGFVRIELRAALHDVQSLFVPAEIRQQEDVVLRDVVRRPVARDHEAFVRLGPTPIEHVRQRQCRACERDGRVERQSALGVLAYLGLALVAGVGRNRRGEVRVDQLRGPEERQRRSRGRELCVGCEGLLEELDRLVVVGFYVRS